MATNRDKRSSLLDFNRGDDWVSPAELRMREQEEERLRQEDEDRINSRGSPSVRGRFRPEEVVEEPSPFQQNSSERFSDTTLDAAQAGVQRSVGGQLGLYQGIGEEQQELSLADAMPWRAADKIGNNLVNKLREVSPFYRDAVDATKETLGGWSNSLMDAADANNRAVEANSRDLDWLDQGVVDLFQSPSSVLSVLGGPAAGVGAADVRGQEYTQGRREGLNHQAAMDRADMMAGIELGTSFVPTGKLLTRIPGVKKSLDDVVQSNVSKFIKRSANQMAGEGLQETAATLGQMGVDAAIARSTDDAELREYSESQLPKDTVDFFNQVRRSAVAGALGGGALGSIETHNSMISDAGKLASDMYLGDLKYGQEGRDPATLAKQLETAVVPEASPQLELFPETTPGPFTPLPAEPEIAPVVLKQPAQKQLTLKLNRPYQPVAGKRAAEAARVSAPVKVQPIVQAKQEVAKPKVTDEQRKTYQTLYPELKTDDQIAEAIVKDKSGGDSVEALKKRVGLPMKTDAAKAGVTPEAVVEHIAKNLGKEKSNALAKLIGDGKLVLDNADSMPVDGAGAYDPKTGRVHINTSTLDPKNITGSILEQAAGHEFDHAARTSGNTDIKRSLGDLFSEPATKKLVADVQKMSQSTNVAEKKWADNVLKLATENSTPATLDREVAGYAVSEALKSRQKGSTAVIARTGTSALRTWAKRVLPGVANDVNVKDLAYLSDKLMSSAARTDKSLAGTVAEDPLAMVMGESAPGYAQAEKEGRAYKDPADGKMKFITSDAAARVDMNTQQYQHLKSGAPTSVVTIFNHSDLWNQYPELSATTVQVDPEAQDGAASYNEQEQKILISKSILEDLRKGKTSAKAVLLHELQHGIQGTEDFARGGGTDQFLSEKDKKVIQSAKFYEDKASAQANAMDDLYPMIPYEKSRREIRRALNQRRDGIITSKEAFDVINEELEGKAGLPKPIVDWKITTDVILDELKTVAPARTAAKDAAYEKYLTLRGEQEARFVQKNADTELEDLPLNPLNDVEYEGETRVSKKLGDVKEGSEMLPMKAEEVKELITTPNVNTKFGKAMQVAKAQLLYHSGLGKELFERLKLSTGEASRDAQRGLNAGANVDQGIKRLAKNEGKTTEEVRTMVEQRMDALAKLPTPEARERALASLVRQYPNLRSLAKAYSDIDQMTKTLVAQMLRANPTPSVTDIQFMNKILNNSFGYTTRMYAAYQGEAGSAYAKKLMDDYKTAQKKLAKDKTLNAAQEKALERVDNAVNFMATHDLTIPAADKIGREGIDKIKYLYDSWIGDADNAYQLAKDEARKAKMAEADVQGYAQEKLTEALLNFAPGVKTEDIQAKAKEAVDNLLSLGDNTGAVPKYLRTASADRGILQKREELPEPIRELLGEIKDPGTRVQATIAKQGELLARNKFLLYMKEHGTGKWVVSPQTNADGKFTSTLDGDGFGALKGWKTTPQIAAVIKDQLGMFSSTADAMAAGFAGADAQQAAWYRGVDDWIKKGAGAAKVASIILEGFNTIMNSVGSFATFVANGAPVEQFISGSKQSMELIKNELVGNKGSLSEDVLDAIAHGVTDSAKVNELKKQAQDQVRDSLTGKGPVTLAGKGLSRAKAVGTEVFAQSDVWPKLAAYKHRKNVLRKYYDAAGIEMSDEDIAAEAATMVKDTNISSDRVPPVLKSLEARGVTRYMPYFWNVPRSLTMSAAHGAADMVKAVNAPNMESRMILGFEGLRRLTGTGAATYGLMLALKGMAAAINGEDQDEVDDIKKVLSPDARYGDLIYLGTDDTKAPLFFRLSRIDPYGPVTDMARMLMDPDTKQEDMAEMSLKYVKDIAFANTYTKLVLDALSDTVGDGKMKDKMVRIERIMPRATSYLKDAMRAFEVKESLVETSVALMDTQLPGQIDMFDPNNKSLMAAKNDESKITADVVKYSGGRLDRADPGLRAYVLGQEVKKRRDEARKLSKEYLAADRPAAALKEARKADQDVYYTLTQLHDVYEGMTDGLKMSPRAAQAALKDAGLTAADIGLIVRGRVPTDLEDVKPGAISRIFSKSSIQMRNKNADKMLSAKDRAAALAERKAYLKSLTDEGAVTTD